MTRPELVLEWVGPLALLGRGAAGFEGDSACDASGVYVLGVPTPTGFLPWWAGVTH